MSNNSNNEKERLKPNRLSLPSSASTTSFLDNQNKYIHLEYHQKMQNILSRNPVNQHLLTPSPLSQTVPIHQINAFNLSYNNFNYPNNFNLSAPLNSNSMDRPFLSNTLNSKNFEQTKQTIGNNRNSLNISQNDNLMIFDTNDESSILDAFDPLRIKTNNHELQKKNNTKSLESIDKTCVNEQQKESHNLDKKFQDIRIRSSTSLEPKQIIAKKIKENTNTDPTPKPTITNLNCSNEIEKFSQQISLLKAQTDSDNQTKKLIVYSSTLDFLLSSSNNTNINLTVRYFGDSKQPNTKRYQPLNIFVSLNSNVETLAYNVLNLYQIEDLNINKYLFKVHGLEEYLPYNSRLSELKYFYDCINQNQEPVLILTEAKNANTILTEKNTKRLFKLNIQNLNQHQITKSKLESILKLIIYNYNLIEESIRNDESLERILNWIRNFIEKVNSLKMALFDIGHDLIEELLVKLDFYEKKLVQLSNSKYLNEKEPLIVNNLNYSYSIDSTNTTTNSKIDHLVKIVQELTRKSLQQIALFVKCACLSFYSDLQSDFVYEQLNLKNSENSKSKEIIEIIQADDKFTFYFRGISRLERLINRLNSTLGSGFELYLKFCVVYGTKILDKVNLKLDKLDKYNTKRNDRFIKLFKIQFDRLDLCVLPREACLFIQLFHTNTSNQTSSNIYNNFLSCDNSLDKAIVISSKMPITGSSYSIYEEPSDKCLAWASKSIFDHEMILENEEYFLSMFDDIPEVTSVCCTASNIYSNKSPILQIQFPKHEKLYKYPNLTYECSCKLKDFDKLSNDVKDKLINICNKSIVANKLTQYEKDLINENFASLNGIPYALSKVYLCLMSYDYSSIIHFYAFLKQCEPLGLAESIELLMPQFPDQELRKHAIKSIEINNDETILLYLPQLLEAIKYEKLNDSELVLMLLRMSNKSLRFAHRLYWMLREFLSRDRDFVLIRYQMLYDALKIFFNDEMIQEIDQEVFMVKQIDQIAIKIKETKDNDRLLGELDYLNREWPKNKECRLPLNISYSIKEIDIRACSFISSFTMPIKLVFKNNDTTANSFYTIYKIGDDLRQDMFVLQMINVMNQLWLEEDLDLNLITFQCLQTGNRRGFIEMVTNAETLKEIQKGAVMNAFKKSCINDWLRSHNPKIGNFKKAVDNFTRSCAAYSVATYLLGIGDRHNDNIMVKYTGHVFHIDFGKYLGDAQTFAGFKRDRNPILFTSDMFYVINQAKEPNYRFQEFIELCCKSFQILRKNYNHLLALIELMIDSGIPGLNRNAIQYVYKNLMIDLDEDEASNALTKMIHDSLSKFASFNFAIHTLAQPKTVTSSNYFSFITHIFNSETDGKIISIKLEGNESTKFNNTKELIKCLVNRETEFESNEVYRTFDEFCELYSVLHKTFPTLKLAETPSYHKFKETKHFLKKFLLVETFLREIMSLHAEISQCEIIYTFFHPILRDKNQETLYLSRNSDTLSTNSNEAHEMLEENYEPDIKGEVKLKLRFKDNKFVVNCLQCRNLKPPFNQSVSSIKPYVKCYLRPDYTKATKKKVQALFNGPNPIFTETMEYEINYDDLKHRTLELSVLNNRINFKDKIGSVEISLLNMNLKSDFVKWYYLR